MRSYEIAVEERLVGVLRPESSIAVELPRAYSPVGHVGAEWQPGHEPGGPAGPPPCSGRANAGTSNAWQLTERDALAKTAPGLATTHAGEFSGPRQRGQLLSTPV